MSSKRRCIFRLPLAPPSGYFGGIQNSTRLRLYCLAAVHLALRLVGGRTMPTARLGRCALSAFSEGGKPPQQRGRVLAHQRLQGAPGALLPSTRCRLRAATATPAATRASWAASRAGRSRGAIGACASTRARPRSPRWSAASAWVAPCAPTLALESTSRTTPPWSLPRRIWDQVRGEPASAPNPNYEFKDLPAHALCLHAARSGQLGIPEH